MTVEESFKKKKKKGKHFPHFFFFFQKKKKKEIVKTRVKTKSSQGASVGSKAAMAPGAIPLPSCSYPSAAAAAARRGGAAAAATAAASSSRLAALVPARAIRRRRCCIVAAALPTAARRGSLFSLPLRYDTIIIDLASAFDLDLKQLRRGESRPTKRN